MSDVFGTHQMGMTKHSSNQAQAKSNRGRFLEFLIRMTGMETINEIF